MFNEFNLSDDEIIKIIKDYKPLIINASIINDRYDEDLAQEIQIEIFRYLSKNRNIICVIILLDLQDLGQKH